MSSIPFKTLRMVAFSSRSVKNVTQAKFFSSLPSDLPSSDSHNGVHSKLQGILTQDRIIRVPQGFVIPEPKPLKIADGNYKGVLTAQLAAGVRMLSGIFVSGWQPTAPSAGAWPGTLGLLRDGSSLLSRYARPTNPLVLFENEADPQSRLVREACCVLDLSVECVPTFLVKNSGGATPLRMQDGSETLSGAQAIIQHLFRSYGPGASKVPLSLSECWGLNAFSSKCASKLRGSAGGDLSPNALPAQVRNQLQEITLWGFEGSPFVRPVRETLSALGLRHTLIPCARGSLNRDKLFLLTGRFQAPYLQDPNTGISMFESGHIVKYLQDAYTVPAYESTGSTNVNTNVGAGGDVSAEVIVR